MKEIFRLKIFWLIFAALSLVLFVAGVNINRVSQSETDFLVISKNTNGAKNNDEIVGNLSAILRSLSFYDKMAAQNPDIADPTAEGLPDAQRKDFWDSKIKVERVAKSGVFKVTAIDKDHFQAELMNTAISKNLLSTFGIYYDIKNEADLRIIDGPITRTGTSQSPYILLGESTAAGFILSYIVFLISISLPKKNNRNFYKSYLNPANERENFFAKKESAIQKTAKTALDGDTEILPKAALPWEKADEAYVPFLKKAAAPDNLPIAEDECGFPMPEKKGLKKEASNIREATEEEVKDRLNKLLSGKL